jgi:hypothetical protein
MTQAPAATKALLFDYRQAANPVRPGLTEPIPYHQWSPELHARGPSGVIPLDLSAQLGAEGPATSPGLAAHFVRIAAGEGVKAAATTPEWELFDRKTDPGQMRNVVDDPNYRSTVNELKVELEKLRTDLKDAK